MSDKKYNDFEDWNSEYDIPDDPKPLEKQYSDRQELVDEVLYKEDKISKISDLKEKSIIILNKQNDYWDLYGDSYKLEELVRFTLRNREEILGIVKNANWLKEADRKEWEEDFINYYDLLQIFVKRATFAIGSYKRSVKKLNKKIEELL